MYYAELRNIRSQLEAVETALIKLAKAEGKILHEVVDDFNEIYSEFTSEYHEQPRIWIKTETY